MLLITMENRNQERDKCNYCDKHSIKAIDAGNTYVCACHFVRNYDEGCLLSLLLEQVCENGCVVECKEVQKEIKKQFPEVYEQLEHAFAV